MNVTTTMTGAHLRSFGSACPQALIPTTLRARVLVANVNTTKGGTTPTSSGPLGRLR